MKKIAIPFVLSMILLVGGQNRSPFLLADVNEYPAFIAEKKTELLQAQKQRTLELDGLKTDVGTPEWFVEASNLPSAGKEEALKIIIERAEREFEQRKCQGR